jgi:hypothetical protein
MRRLSAKETKVNKHVIIEKKERKVEKIKQIPYYFFMRQGKNKTNVTGTRILFKFLTPFHLVKLQIFILQM